MSGRRIAIVLLLAGCSHGSRVENPSPTTGSAPAARSDLGGELPGPSAATPPAPGPDATAVTPAVPPAKVKIVVRASPAKVFVSWGKKKLGVTPLTIERPRDSGPVDLVLRAQGYFPVHTRAYTVKNDVVVVKLTKLQDRMTIFGAKAEIPPDDPTLAPNAPTPGAPTAPAPTPPAPTPPAPPAPAPTPPPAP